MKIFVNGEAVHCATACTIEELIRQHQLSSEVTLVEYNGTALQRREWPEQQLRENDQVEILRVAAGG